MDVVQPGLRGKGRRRPLRPGGTQSLVRVGRCVRRRPFVLRFVERGRVDGVEEVDTCGLLDAIDAPPRRRRRSGPIEP